MKRFGAFLLLLALSVSLVTALSAKSSQAARSSSRQTTMFERLKWNGAKPSFDVLAKTQEYVSKFDTVGGPSEDYYGKDYVLRGAVIGPMTRADLVATQTGFDLKAGFPDLTQSSFGFAVDPENPFRCFWLQRWHGTNTGSLTVGGTQVPPTYKTYESPVWTNSVVWTQGGQIIYEQVGATVDRFEGNSAGKAAVFGLLHTAGINIPGGPGDWKLRILQRLGHLAGNGRSWSREEDIPKWWTSKSRGGDPTD
jgi:hypothetical protein